MPRRVFRLSEKEAQVLQTIFHMVGGHPRTTSRGVVEILSDRINHIFGRLKHLDTTGSIYFIDKVREVNDGTHEIGDWNICISSVSTSIICSYFYFYTIMPSRKLKREGNCYNATRALYLILGGKRSGYRIRVVKDRRYYHCFLEHWSGLILDPSRRQFRYEKGPGYKNSHKFEFMGRPSKEVLDLIDRLTWRD